MIKVGGRMQEKKLLRFFQNLGGEEKSQIIMEHKLSTLRAVGDSFYGWQHQMDASLIIWK